MPQFVPPPLIPDADEERWVACDSEMTRDEKYAFETERPIIDLDRLKRLAREGTIPDEHRAVYWMVLLESLPVRRSQRGEVTAVLTANYDALVNDLLADLRDKPLPIDDDPRRIDVDIPRTMPALHFFASHEGSPSCAAAREKEAAMSRSDSGCDLGGRATPSSAADGAADPDDGDDGARSPASARPDAPPSRPVPFAATGETCFTPNQLALRRVLHLFARLNAGAGYIQGMNELVGHLMYAFCGGKGVATAETEACVFFSFQKLHQFVGDNFQRELDLDSTGVKGTLAAFTALLTRVDKDTAQHLAKLGLEPEFYAFRWITLMFSQDFTTPDLLSLWDFLLSFREDLDAAVLFTAVAMVETVRDRILEGNFSSVIQMLQSYPPEIELNSIKQRSVDLMAEYGVDAARSGRVTVSSRPNTPPAEPASSPASTASGEPEKKGGLRGFVASISNRFSRKKADSTAD